MSQVNFPLKRMRRMRTDAFSRVLMQEHSLHIKDLILPVFVTDNCNNDLKIPSLPGIYRYTCEKILPLVEECLELGIPAIALFPVIDQKDKTETAEEAFNDKGLVPNVVRAIKKRFPEMGIITDVALDPYTSHGQDGVIDSKGYVVNDETVDILSKQALCHAQAGADIVAPSDMMDGRIRAIRQCLDHQQLLNTKILSYAVKYASCLYGPFRDAVNSSQSLAGQSKSTYQMDIGNVNEALQEVFMDLSEGADIVMVKPGLSSLDVIRLIKQEFKVPTMAYQVSGEYAMVNAAANNKQLDEKSTVLEILHCFKRAGCDAVFTYYALKAAKWLREMGVQ